MQTTDEKRAQCAMPTFSLIHASPSSGIAIGVTNAASPEIPRLDKEPTGSQLHVASLLIVNRKSDKSTCWRNAHVASEIHIQCAALLVKSAHVAGYPVTLFTNEKAYVRERFEALGVDAPVRIEERARASRLDRSLQHRSTHQKLDIIRELAQGGNDHISMLVELDAVFLRPLRLSELPNAGQIGCYDISDMMRAESAGQSDGDIRNLTLRFRDCNPRWFGGEVIAGNALKLQELVGYLDEVEPRYWRLRERLYHPGDEAPVSSALNLYLARGGAISEMGERRAITRWWTASRPFQQPDFASVVDRAVLHLPADKKFLASMADKVFDPCAFIAAYRRYARPRLFNRRIKSFIFKHLRHSTPGCVASL